ncbi:ammonia-forming cytochrome c nitrite reductase subunit c552 [soil metagenome]
MDTEISDVPKHGRRWLIVTVIITALATFGIAALLTNIFTHKQEARNPYIRFVDVNEVTTDASQWGKNWPREYDGYLRTADVTSTKFGGSESAPPASRLEKDPWLKRMFAGYAFAIEFNVRRGHAYMLFDQERTKRVLDKPQPGACLHCHASIIPTYRRVGLEAKGQTLSDFNAFDWPAVMEGFGRMSAMSYTDAHAELLKTPDGSPGSSASPRSVMAALPLATKPTTQEALAHQAGQAHPVSCIDCHDPKMMSLRVTRPGFINGIQALAASDAPTPHLPSIERWRKGGRNTPYDPNVDASRQEMRSFVCGQCHVEYYCGPKETLFFPWTNGLKVEQIEKTYDEHRFPDGHRFFDFKHAETGAEVLKAQHPEFEMWSQGIHARSGVACADCHMPYKREGALKVSEHHVQSPLLMVNQSCQTCHRFPEEELTARVELIQHRTSALMERAGAALTDLLDAINAAKHAGASDEQLAPILALQRKAQWRLDFVNAENSMGFHASQEAARILGEAIDYARQGQVAATRLAPGNPNQAAK